MLVERKEIGSQEALERISKSRAPVDPEKDNPEPQEIEVLGETETTSVVDEKPIELETSSDTPNPETNDDDDLYVDYKGREISLKEIEEWEQGNLRQSDYTQKTQELASQKTSFEKEQQDYNDKLTKLNDNITVLESILSEDELSSDELTNMREFEPEDYIQYTEKQQKRKEALLQAKKNKPVSVVNVDNERQKLWEANPQWMDNGKSTKAYDDDMLLIETYTNANGYSSDEIQGITNHRHWLAMIDAAKYKALSDKGSIIAKKVRKAPVTTKPRAVDQGSLQQNLKDAREKLKKTGHHEDAVLVRRIQRELAKE